MRQPHYTSALQRRGRSPLADELSALFAVIDDEPLLARLATYRWTGRQGWGLRPLWRAYVAGFTLSLPTTNALVRRLQDDYALREVCGFGDDLPSRWTFNRFISRLTHHTDLVEEALAGLTDRLHDLLPDFGKGLAVDASAVRSWSNPNKRHISDPEASWTAKTSNRSKSAKEWFWGYKLHLVVDDHYELPIAAMVTTASVHDSRQLPPLIEQARARFDWLRPSWLSADAGYDARSNSKYVTEQLQAVPIIKMRKFSTYKGDREASQDGNPRCLGGQDMTFMGYTADGKMRYACPAGGCELQERKGVRYCDSVIGVDSSEDPRRFPPIPRRSREWKALYSRRQSVERCFSRLKQHRTLDAHCRRSLRRVRLHALMAVLTMQATAVVRAGRGEVEAVREVSRRVA